MKTQRRSTLRGALLGLMVAWLGSAAAPDLCRNAEAAYEKAYGEKLPEAAKP